MNQWSDEEYRRLWAAYGKMMQTDSPGEMVAAHSVVAKLLEQHGCSQSDLPDLIIAARGAVARRDEDKRARVHGAAGLGPPPSSPQPEPISPLDIYKVIRAASATTGDP